MTSELLVSIVRKETIFKLSVAVVPLLPALPVTAIPEFIFCSM